MNIFILDYDPYKCAEYMVDRHIVKMITEHAQMLSTVCRESGLDCGYKSTHKNHPCTKWVAESRQNWQYLFDLTSIIHREWQYRYGHPKTKIHKSYQTMSELYLPDLPNKGITKFAQAMPVQYKSEDVVEAYRKYYVNDKRHLAKWTKREIPEWWK